MTDGSNEIKKKAFSTHLWSLLSIAHLQSINTHIHQMINALTNLIYSFLLFNNYIFESHWLRSHAMDPNQTEAQDLAAYSVEVVVFLYDITYISDFI